MPISSIRAAVFGGHQKWLPKLKQAAPHFKYKDKATQHDCSIIENVDVVCVNIENISHKSFDNIQVIARQYGKPLVFFQGTNIKRNLDIIQQAAEKGAGNARYKK
jgi:hypothetical protein